jgi:hypothetical protein
VSSLRNVCFFVSLFVRVKPHLIAVVICASSCDAGFHDFLFSSLLHVLAYVAELFTGMDHLLKQVKWSAQFADCVRLVVLEMQSAIRT